MLVSSIAKRLAVVFCTGYTYKRFSAPFSGALSNRSIQVSILIEIVRPWGNYHHTVETDEGHNPNDIS